MPWPGEQGTPDELQKLIAKAVYPWIGERSSGTIGEERINRECSYRATNNLLAALEDAGYAIVKVS